MVNTPIVLVQQYSQLCDSKRQQLTSTFSVIPGGLAAKTGVPPTLLYPSRAQAPSRACTHNPQPPPHALAKVPTKIKRTHRVRPGASEVRGEALPQAGKPLRLDDVAQGLQRRRVLQRSPVRIGGLALHPSFGRVLSSDTRKVGSTQSDRAAAAAWRVEIGTLFEVVHERTAVAT